MSGQDLLGEAADWLIRFQCGDNGPATRKSFERWRQQSPSHAAAWERAETVLGTFGQVPPALGNATLQRIERPARRQALRALGGLLVAAPAAWLAWRHLPWQNWSADIRTATGEQKTMTLADGTRLVLNTASGVDIVFNENERRVRLLAGEILVTTGADPSPTHRPFIVQTAQGGARALGTRFLVRLGQDSTRVAVYEGAVAITPLLDDGKLILRAGQQTVFGCGAAQPPQPADPSAPLWEHGMLMAADMRLADLAAELGRYRNGVLRCAPGVAELRVSGAFPIRDTDASLRLLEKTLPLRIGRLTRYWVSLEPQK